MSRRRKRSKIWDYKRAEIITRRIVPACYYQEKEILAEEIELKLEDATMEQWLDLYKRHHQKYFSWQKNSKIAFYSDGLDVSGIPLLFNEDFFTAFSEGRYYCRLNSFSNLKHFLVEEHYPNQTEYNKAANYIESYFGDYFWEGSKLISLKFFNCQTED